MLGIERVSTASLPNGHVLLVASPVGALIGGIASVVHLVIPEVVVEIGLARLGVSPRPLRGRRARQQGTGGAGAQYFNGRTSIKFLAHGRKSTRLIIQSGVDTYFLIHRILN